MAFYRKRLRVPAPVVIAGRHVKRYHVNLDGSEIDETLQKAAYAFLPDLFPEPDGTPPATFTVLHETADGVFLNAYSWYWDNVLHCRTAAAGIPFLGSPDEDRTHWAELAKPLIGCVWELPPIEHERSSWVRHMLEPDRPDLDAYLADLLPEGPVG
ncbi:hypothetical protein HS041_08875 [Planomonospora sp. ID67723]|uniref:hypothetical protein n=1 Tax=Planomonospora sp. ID67723 TaxID=2738134 RepID=UPI001A1FD539|nr:hypothetical protein [Planomonospora sp. ID67723]MBG0827877.1 hypothetical protein [Planomonospora sp. ID67723]